MLRASLVRGRNCQNSGPRAGCPSLKRRIRHGNIKIILEMNLFWIYKPFIFISNGFYNFLLGLDGVNLQSPTATCCWFGLCIPGGSPILINPKRGSDPDLSVSRNPQIVSLLSAPTFRLIFSFI